MSQTRHMIIARYIGKLDWVNCMHTQRNRLNCTLHICGVLEAGHSSGAAAVKLTHRWATLDWWAESVVVAGGVCWDGGSVGARCICGVLEAGHRGRAAAVVGSWGTSWCDWAQARQRRQNHPQRLTSRSSDVGRRRSRILCHHRTPVVVNDSVPVQRCRLPGLAISNAEILA